MFTVKVLDARLARANLVTKTDFDTKLISLNKKINSNKTNYKHLIQFILKANVILKKMARKII